MQAEIHVRVVDCPEKDNCVIYHRLFKGCRRPRAMSRRETVDHALVWAGQPEESCTQADNPFHGGAVQLTRQIFKDRTYK